MENFKAKFTVTQQEGGVTVETDICGDICKEFYDLRAEAIDKAVTERLIALGWTPPVEPQTNEANDECK